MSAEVRLRRLQQLVLDPGFLGLEPLLDLLLGVHQELGASDLAQDKYVADFLQWGECPPARPCPVGGGGRAEAGNGVGHRRLWRAGQPWGELPIQGPEHGPGSWGDMPLPRATLAGQSGVSRGQDSEPGLGSHGRLGWEEPPMAPCASFPTSRPSDMRGVLPLRCPHTPEWALWPPPGSPSTAASTGTDGAAARGAVRGQVLGASLPSCPDRCPGPDRPSDSGRPQGTTSSETGAIQARLPPEGEPHPFRFLYVCSLEPSSQTRYFSFVVSVLRGSHKAPPAKSSPEIGPGLQREDA